MEKEKVSIVVSCYNQAEFLPETLDSVSAQTYANWECIVVNDGSSDQTEEVAKCYVQKDRRFKYVFQENAGPSVARNVAVGNSEGEFVLPLDADDLIAPTYLEKAVGRFLRFPETKLVYCKAEKFGKEQGGWDLPAYDYDSFIWQNCLFCTAMFRRVDFDKVGGYNENMTYGNEDWDFFLSLLAREDVVYRIEEVLFRYRVKEVSRTTLMQERYKEESLVQLYKNHRDLYEPYMEDYCERIVFNRMEGVELEALRAAKKADESVRESLAYRFGKAVLRPFSVIRRIVGK